MVRLNLFFSCFSLTFFTIPDFHFHISCIYKKASILITSFLSDTKKRDRQNAIAIFTKAPGHPARVAIIEYLMKVDFCICGDIVNELPLAQPTISQHLKELKQRG